MQKSFVFQKAAAENAVTLIVPMDWHTSMGLQNLAYVISLEGKVIGYQTKNQLDPTEDEMWGPGDKRTLFDVNGIKFGITICHEGFRYPESARWAARHGAKIIFHPQCTLGDKSRKRLIEWGHKDNPYYENAMVMRALENTVYFASVNYASEYAESASSVIDPEGRFVASKRYGEPELIVAEIDLTKATGLLAKRFRNELYY